MMHTWFECKIRYDKIMADGMVKKVTEPYLFDALSFTEAEARTIEELAPFITGEFTVTAISRAAYSEVFMHSEGDRWFKCRIAFLMLDEKSGRERETKTTVLVQADSLQEAKDRLVEAMKGTMADYIIKKVEETEIMDVYPYLSESDKEA